MTRPRLVYIVTAIELLFSVLVFPSGYLLITDPSGASMGIDFARTYFPIITDFFLVGIFLIVAYGLVPLVIVYGLIAAKQWAWDSGVAFGAVAILWIAVKLVTMYQMGFIFFQPLIAGLGLLNILLLYRPSVRKYLGKINNN